MKKSLVVALSVSGLLFLTACGGGDNDVSTAINAPVEYQLRTAYLNQLTMLSGSRKFKLTGSFVENGFSETINGEGTEDIGAMAATTFEGKSAQKKTTITRGFAVVANNRNVTLDSVEDVYFDTNYNPLGQIGNEYVDENGSLYTVVTSSTPIPATARVNDSGSLSSSNRYSSTSRTKLLGTYNVSYIVQEDTASTALLKLVGTLKDTAGKTKMTVTVSYRMTPAGVVTKINKTEVSYSSNFSATTTLNTSY